MRAIRGAFAYFTVLPTAAGDAAAPGPDALAALPLIGAVVGAIAGLLGYGAFAWLHAGWSFVVAWAAAIALTGAVHVDGFLDACDGLFVTATPQRRREILRDPHHGTFAIVGMVMLAAFWLAALAQIAPARYPLVLAFSGAAARLAIVPNAWLFPYGRGGSMPATFASRPSPAAFVAALALIEVLGWFVAPWACAIAPLAIGLALAAGWWANRRLDGLTGDVYGAAIVTIEVLALLAIAR